MSYEQCEAYFASPDAIMRTDVAQHIQMWVTYWRTGGIVLVDCKLN